MGEKVPEGFAGDLANAELQAASGIGIEMMQGYPKIKSVLILPEKKLRVEFANGEVRIYDCHPLLNEPTFQQLKDDAFFRNVQVDATGYGVVWDDNVDLSESELWIHGVAETTV
jgi:hypothetical protein